MTVFFQKLFECGFHNYQDDTMCRRKLSVFLGLGNISKIPCCPLKNLLDADGFSMYIV